MAGTIAYRAEIDGSWILLGSRLRPGVRAVVRRDPATGDTVATIGQEEIARVPGGSFRDAAIPLEAALRSRALLARNSKWSPRVRFELGEVALAEEAEIDVDGKYAVICPTHGNVVGSRTKADAVKLARATDEFCDECRAST
jgi:hypothetical protein